MEQTSVEYLIGTELTIPPSDDWLQVLEEENVQLVILDPILDSELVEVIRSQPEWSVDSEDDELMIFTLSKRH